MITLAVSTQYLVKESAISALINAVFSIVFVFIIFYPTTQIAVFGAQGLIVDAIPQSLAITFMATLIPTLVTRSRKRNGVIAASDERRTWLPKNAVIRALTLAILIALLAVVVHFVLFSLIALDTVNFTYAAVAKVIYGALLGALVTRYTVSLLFSPQSF